MRRRYIAVYGGTDLSASMAGFVRALADAILRQTNAVIVTGGFDHLRDAPDHISVDRSVLKATEEFLAEGRLPLETRLETWLPKPELDRPEVLRFRAGKIREMSESARARRMALVKDVDALVTIKGKDQTALVLDLAFTYNRPVLPLPFTGGDSGDYWKRYRAEILEHLHLPEPFARELETVHVEDLSAQESQALATRVVEILNQGVERKCLVLMPYRADAELFFRRTIKRVLQAQRFEPVRIDNDLETGYILEIFLKRLGDSDAVLADVTGANANVMYELGQAHARGINPLLFWRGETTADLPFYLSEQKIEVCKSSKEGPANFVRRIKAYLQAVRTGALGGPGGRAAS